jgi:hypothetical protein
VYVVTSIGSGATNWVLTRASDADTYGFAGPDTLSEGSTFFVQEGATGAGETYTCNTVGTITFGTTNITFVQISSAQIYSAGTGLTLTGVQFSITDTGTAGTYGSASQVPVFTTNAQGQVTAVTNTAIGITSAAVSGLAASATTDTTNAANITTGTLNTARLSGSYTGITGVGTLAAGTWNANVIGAVYGGTGFASYTVGDLLFADTTTSLAKLAGAAVGNALISGGVASAPSYGKIGLATHVSGTLPVANGGTGITSAGTAGNVLTSNGTGWASSAPAGFPSGTKLLFQQTAAPTGWTKDTSHNNKALRVVSGTAGSGGSVAFTTAFASKSVSGTVGDTTLSTSQIPSHTHTGTTGNPNTSLTGSFAFTDDGTTSMAMRVRSASGVFSTTSFSTNPINSSGVPATATLPYDVNIDATHTHNFTTGSTGSGGSHTHSFTGTAIDLAVQYIDVIVASKD